MSASSSAAASEGQAGASQAALSSQGQAIASQAALASVLDFLFAANLETADAFSTAKKLIEAGVSDRAAIASLTPERLKSLTDKRLHRKLLGAIRRMPTLDAAAVSPSSPKRAKQGSEAMSAPPPPTPGEHDGVLVVNRSPVMILWASACAHVGDAHNWSEALSLGSACAALFARSKGASLGLYESAPAAFTPPSQAERVQVSLLGKEVPAARTAHGVRGFSEAKHRAGCYECVEPASVYRYLERAFGAGFGNAWVAMVRLARAVPTASFREAGNRLGFQLYTRFRPQVPDGLNGWGQPGRLLIRDIDQIASQYLPRDAVGQPSVSLCTSAAAVVHASGSLASPAPKTEQEPKVDVESTATPSAIMKCIADAGSEGISVERLAIAIGTTPENVRSVSEIMQLEGILYERSGRLVAL